MSGITEKGKDGFQAIYSPSKIEEVCQRYIKYITETDIPIIKEFSLLEKIPYATLYEIPEFRELTRICAQKKEVGLERKGQKNPALSSFIQFSLKQLGWRDRFEHDLGDSVINVVIKSKEDM